MRRLAASIMYDHSQVLFESRGVECGERAFDAKQVEAWQKAQKNGSSDIWSDAAIVQRI